MTQSNVGSMHTLPHGENMTQRQLRTYSLRTPPLMQGNRVIGTISMRTPRGATGQEISGGPSVAFVAPVKGEYTGRLTVQFTAGDTAGVYTTTLRMNNGTSVTMYVTATD
jgi:hypothetical protein